MGHVEDIIKDYDVFTHDGFERAMREAKHVPEGELVIPVILSSLGQ